MHDVRVPGMLHGRVVRPPYAGFDHGDHVGKSLISIDESSVADIPGLVAVVAIGDFVGVVATREENAAEAARRLKVVWRTPPELPDLNSPEKALRANPSTPRKLADRGNVDLALANSANPMERTYVWPYQMHGSIGPSCAVADYRDDGLTVWSGTQNPFPMRRDLALLLDMPEEAILVERLEAAGCYGRNCADDVTADAALLSRAVGQPVRVQLTREQEHAWEPKGAAQVMDVRGGLDLEGGPAAYDFETRYPSNLAPTLPLILTGKVAPVADVMQMGDRTAIPPYAYGNLRVTVHDMPPIARASWFRGVSAMPNTFAHECYIDELASAAEVDPIEYRLRYLQDPRAVDLVHAVAERAKWVPHTKFGTLGGEGDLLYGRGFAYAVYVHGKFPGTAAAWAAWVADVAVNRKTGDIAVTKVTCGQDSGLMINPDGVRHQIHGNIIQSTSRVLKEQVGFSSTAVASKEWGGYPLITFPEVPEIDVLMIPRPDEPPLGVGEVRFRAQRRGYCQRRIRCDRHPFSRAAADAGYRSCRPERHLSRKSSPLTPAEKMVEHRPFGGRSDCRPFGARHHGVAVAPGHQPDRTPEYQRLQRRHDRARPHGCCQSGPAMSAISAVTARLSRADASSIRRSARSMPPTSHRILTMASAIGPTRLSSAPCARALAATDIISIRPTPIRPSLAPRKPTCRRFMPI